MGLAPADHAEVAPAEVFALLGNEIRMGILQALWEAYDPLEVDAAVSFSELYDAVDVDDSGQFNYHLDRLCGRYVRRTDDGYTFHPVGLKLVQSVIAGAGQDVTVEPAPAPTDCRLCGAPTQITYEDGRAFHRCTACGGHFDTDEYSAGTLWGASFPPAGVVHRSPEELFATLTFLDYPMKAMLSGGVCPRCRGALDHAADTCEDHETDGDGPCEHCGYTQQFRVEWRCEVCKYHATGSIGGIVKNHPAVIAFDHDHGISFGYPYAPNDIETIRESERVLQEIDYEETAVSTDPLKVQVSISYEGDSIALVVDEELDVVEVTE